MRTPIIIGLCCLLTLLTVMFLQAQTRGQENGSFYEKGLHYTNGGLAYWYSNEHGGEELASQIPISKLQRRGCHAPTCDTCHMEMVRASPFTQRMYRKQFA